MSESFATLLDEKSSTLEMQPGSIVTGVVLDVDKDWVTVHVGLKSEGVIALDSLGIMMDRLKLNLEMKSKLL